MEEIVDETIKESKRWTFTFNNYTDESIATLKNVIQELCIYLHWSHEIAPTTGTPHLQGYLELKSKMRGSTLGRFFKDQQAKPKFIGSKGTAEQNQAYIDKQDFIGPKQIYVYGEPSKTVPGQRTDLQAFQLAVKKGVVDRKRLREDFAEVCAKYPRFVDSYIRDQIQVPKEPDHVYRPWQQELAERLNQPADNRTINFIVDSVGDQGKSWFAKKWLETHPSSFLMRPGKHADMAYILPDKLDVLFLDCTRKQLEYVPYTLLEELKDGYVMSTKYETIVKRYPSLHIVVLMNQMPDMTALSQDRYRVTDLHRSQPPGARGPGSGASAPLSDPPSPNRFTSLPIRFQ